MMKKVAQSLDALVETLPALEAALKNADAIDDAAFKRLLETAGRPKLAKKSDAVSPEYAKALVAAAIIELKKLQRFAESDEVADEFPEMVDEGGEGEAPATEGEPEVPATTEEGEPALTEESADTPASSTIEDEPEVEVTIDGDGVQVVHGEDSKLYMILPDNSVLKMEEATEREAKVARFLLQEQKTAGAEKPADPKKVPTVDSEAEEKKAKDEAEKVREQAVKDSEAEKNTVRTDKAIRKETKAFFHPAARRRSAQTSTQNPNRTDQSSRKS
jgi:hypothetical protein